MVFEKFFKNKIKSYKRSLVVPDNSPFSKSSAYYNYYSHPIMNYLNWNRLKIAFDLLKSYKLLNKNYEVLDAGCGGGIILPTLSKYYRKVCAVDYSEDINVVEEWFFNNNYGKNVHFQKADIRELPFNDEQFDMVFSLDVLEHILDVEVAIEEIKRVLKQKGHLLVTLPLEEFPHSVGRKVYGLGDPGHYKGSAKNSNDVLKIFLENEFIKLEDIKTPFKFLPSKINLYRVLLFKLET